MRIISTLFQRNESSLASKELTVDYSSIDIDLLLSGQQFSRDILLWTPNQEIVSLPQDTFYTRTGKRAVDLFIAMFVIVFILSWLIPIIGALLIIESKGKGPILFIQKRTGRKGRPFLCLKFRTMRPISEMQQGFRQTAKNDDRVTTIGQFLRRTNLDEMPQFINVLLGEMSLVGPRPHAVPHDAMHWDSPAYRERYWVRPGITGLAQVRGARGAADDTQRMDHRVRYDHLYIPRQTLMFDMKICYRAVKLMFKGDRNAW